MMSVEHGIVTDPDEVKAVIGALSVERNRLLLRASRSGRTVGALATVHKDRFVLASTLLHPAPVAPILVIARGGVVDLAAEVCTIVDDIADDLVVPATPVTPGRSTPLPAEDALMLADQLRHGDPAHIDEARTLCGLTDTPAWLRGLAPGAQARLSAILLQPAGLEVFADISATPDGWGELLCSDDEMLTFEPLTADEVRAHIVDACEALVARTGARQEVA